MWLGSSQNDHIQRWWCWSQSRTFKIIILRMIPSNDLQLEQKFLRKSPGDFTFEGKMIFERFPELSSRTVKAFEWFQQWDNSKAKLFANDFRDFAFGGNHSKMICKTRFYYLPFTFMWKIDNFAAAISPISLKLRRYFAHTKKRS